ncbi:MAG TPA: HAMP domain-containing sensor histidine kinase [Acidimicrobiales bacterium]|nr:HAMP domain-containing sensor histidine kinase [Acidimicrobiales bacterium]
MIVDSLLAGALTLVVGLGLALLVRTLPSVRLQLVGLVVLAVTVPLAVVLLSGAVMLHMGAEFEVLTLSAAAAVAGIVGALLIARTLTARLERVRRASVRLAAGDLGERAPEGGPAEIAELAASFNAMADHLEEVFDARRQLVAWASHDLRAPVTSLKAMLEAIDDGVVDASQYLGPLQEQVGLLGALIDEVFELACIDAGASDVHPGPVDLAALVRRSVGRFGPEAEARGVDLGTRDPASAEMARCDEVLVERVLANLIGNALRHTPAGGSVTVACTPGDDEVVVSVLDTGPGIAPESLERVFEPFFRGDEARTPGRGGAGLGLAIARGLVEAQGGRIWAEAPPAGALLRFALPRTSADADAAAIPATARTGLPAGPARLARTAGERSAGPGG